MKTFTNALVALGALATSVAASNPIVAKGQDFVDSVTDKRFMVLGVDYQPFGQGADLDKADPLSNATECLRDAALMQNLGVNTIRSYNLNPSLNHDECMSIFNSVGIYIILDVNSPAANQHLDRSDPASTYTKAYLTHVFTMIEAFKNYPNTLAFFSGNEIMNDVESSMANPPYVRALQREMKSYIKNHANRTIPVGYSAADVRSVLEDTWAYLQCDNSDDGSDDLSRSDFFGLNSYSWCGSEATFTSSGYDKLVETFSNSTIPVFFSEYGCNEVQPRTFDEVPVLYGEKMTVMSGGLIFEWTQEDNNYGIVDAYHNGTVHLRGDYDALMQQYSGLNITLIENHNNTATSLKPPKCSAGLIGDNGVSKDFDLPSVPDGVADLISNGLPSANAGSVVPVTKTKVDLPVYATSGGEISGLAISPADGSNKPGKNGGLTTGEPSAAPSGNGSDNDASQTGSGGSSPTGSSEGASSTDSSSAAGKAVVANGAALGAVLGLALFAL
ncbi:hypothetical protein WHR41_03215 [Cladosporium halotolerans]|uniref:1,3-beta-glucanosyltransferase n=1 Tax=Cladosporium halotolerans TaxID=1052096 RepID=A0AB34KWV7_9PEZI